MGTKTSSQRKVRKERKLRRWALLVALGVLLGGGSVLFFAKIYNPFGGTIDSPLVLIPDDMDFVISIPDFPHLVGEIRDQPFVESLDDHTGFQGFLKTPFARRTGIVDTLRDVFRSLDDLAGQVPLGMDLYGDVSGGEVIVAGYLPEGDEERFRFMAVFQPESWKTIAGANVLLDETLFGWIPEGWLGDLQVEHRRDQVKLRFAGADQELWLTRIADAIIVSTEERQLARIHNAVQKSGLPDLPAPRYLRLQAMVGSSSRVQLLARRKKVNEFLGLEQHLLDLWGSEDLDLAESTLPRLGGDDVTAELDVSRGLGLSVGGPVGERKKGDLSRVFEPYSRDNLQDAFQALSRILPKDVYGVVHVRVPLGDLVEALFERENLISMEERKLLEESISESSVFRSLGDMFATMSRHTGDQVSLVFFKQPREAIPSAAGAGFALVSPIRDASGLRSVIGRLENEIESSDGRHEIKQIYREKRGEMELFKPVIRAGRIDDPDVTIPGFAFAQGYLVLTNYFPWLRDLGGVLLKKKAPLAEREGFETALSYAPEDLLIAGLVDGAALFPYLDQSVPGWVHNRISATNDDYMRWLREGRDDGRRRGIPAGPELEAHADRHLEQQRRHFEARGPGLAREMREYLGYFRGLVGSAGFFAESVAGRTRVELRIDLKPQPK